MRLSLRLALDGIRKNRRLYLPYLMTCSLMVAIYYILAFLSQAELVQEMSGGSSTSFVLELGTWTMYAFSVLFLFYTHSFLVRRRKKEFGLYSVLGMNRRKIGRILGWEVLVSAGASLGVGLVGGIALSKLAELGLLNLMEEEIGYRFTVAWNAVGRTGMLFGLIFLLIYLNTLREVYGAPAVTLLRSEQTGERPPKANWVTAGLGALVLGVAYDVAILIEQPIEALLVFFVAVILVIIATYLLMIAGSVWICRFLQRKKSYYYRTQHFISVSSMAYRMKRNGAGLASICILLTMVLVMISSSACLYFGKDYAITARYPKDICAFANRYGYRETDGAEAEELVTAVERSILPSERQNLRSYYSYCITGHLQDSRVSITLNSLSDLSFIRYNEVAEVHFIRLSDYNRMHGTQETLGEGEALLCAVKTDDVGDVFWVDDLAFRVVKRIDQKALDFDGASQASVISNVFVVVNDIEAVAKQLAHFQDYDGTPMLLLRWYYEFDTEASTERQLELTATMTEAVQETEFLQGDGVNFYCKSHAEQRGDFYGTFGGLFFIGILLSLVFLVAAALIIYYKQISEGYEDAERFAIMQKLGLTRQEIRKSVDVQMLTVFFLPLGFAVLHLGFAFPMVNKLLMLFGVFHTQLLAITTAVSILLCAIFYVLVYRGTSRAYFALVSGDIQE